MSLVLYSIVAAEKTRDCLSCNVGAPPYLFGSSVEDSQDCPHCGEPLVRRRSQMKKIEEEDMNGPRVLRQMEDIVVVLNNPYRESPYLQEKLPETERPNFVVTRKGFQVYAKSYTVADLNHPDGEPDFHGSLVTDRVGPPVYRIRVTL